MLPTFASPCILQLQVLIGQIVNETEMRNSDFVVYAPDDCYSCVNESEVVPGFHSSWNALYLEYSNSLVRFLVVRSTFQNQAVPDEQELPCILLQDWMSNASIYGTC
jgi:hypothetical protein